MIGQLSSDSGIAIVVPAYFVCAGILLYTGIVSAILGMYRGRAPVHLAFALTCFMSAIMSFSFSSYYLASSVHGGVEAQRWVLAASIVFMLGLFLFVGIFTEARGMRRVYAGATALAAIFVVATFALPYGTRWSAVQSYGWMYMPWGESLFHLNGEMGAWYYALRAASLAVVVWTVSRLLQLHRSGRRRDALVLAIYIVVLFASSVQGALIDRGWTETFHTVPVALVGLALLMSVSLGIRMREENLKLEDIAARLAEENDRRREAEAKMRERAFTDGVTGLRNRLFVQDRLCGLVDFGPEKAHGAVLLCDFDHFKVVNDALSHGVGDDLLREAALRLTRLAGAEASVVNMGADAFMIVPDRLFDEEAQAQARIEELARDATREMSRPFVIGERSVSLTASAGVATFASRSGTATEVIGRAEMALERAKKRGRNNIQPFVPSLQSESAERFRLIEGLRHAIDAGELALHYQPQLDTSGALVGAEALMRWNSSSMGAVPPSTFIPVAEETGLIHALGEWSLREGCTCLAKWRKKGSAFDGHLSINVSPWQLARPEFVDRLCETLDATHVEPGHLTLEITESAVLFDVNETVAKLRQIRPLGVRIALDDFGTGYSSLALIKDLPLDAIKIDQSFVRHLQEGANKHLIRVVVAIGAELGLEIIAEGVETAGELDALAALGCTRLQGYFLGRPMPAAQFEAWVAQRPALANRVSA
ncbi:MAG TPA: EAL domain-containing protein [Usitatibacter sp.]|nr:EAL domain-containing protein [Usitatibacter sp.]